MIDRYHEVKRLLPVPGAFLEAVGVKLGGRVPLELGLEDVAAQSIGEETPLVQVHLLRRRLEVQGHCRGSGGI